MVVEALTVFLMLNFLDWFVTVYALNKKLAQEANPVARLIYEKFGSTGLFSFKQVGVGVVAFMAYVFGGLSFESTIWLYNTIFALVVAWNSFTIWRALKSKESG